MDTKVKYVGKVSLTPAGAWSINKNYERLDVVTVYNEDKSIYGSFIAKRAVPANTLIDNQDYWQNIVTNTGVLDKHIIDFINSSFEESYKELIKSVNSTLDLYTKVIDKKIHDLTMRIDSVSSEVDGVFNDIRENTRNITKVSDALTTFKQNQTATNQDVAKRLITLETAKLNSYTKEEVNKKFDDLVGGAPAALDTLKEIADRLKDNDDAVAAVIGAIGTKLDGQVFETYKNVNDTRYNKLAADLIEEHDERETFDSNIEQKCFDYDDFIDNIYPSFKTSTNNSIQTLNNKNSNLETRVGVLEAKHEGNNSGGGSGNTGSGIEVPAGYSLVVYKEEVVQPDNN